MATCALISQTKGQSQGRESKALSFLCLYGHHPPISPISSSSRWRLLAPRPQAEKWAGSCGHGRKRSVSPCPAPDPPSLPQSSRGAGAVGCTPTLPCGVAWVLLQRQGATERRCLTRQSWLTWSSLLPIIQIVRLRPETFLGVTEPLSESTG